MSQQVRRRTLKDVAEAAGVSEMTVSRVLRKTGVVSKRTSGHVLRIVDDLGYVPNRLAGSLATSRSNQVAVIIPTLTSSVFTQVVRGITDILEPAGYAAIMGISDYRLDKEETLVRSMMSWRPAGFVMPNRTHTDKTEKMLANAGIPVVQMMNLTRDPIYISVGVNQEKAGRMLADHMVSRGYRRFGQVGQNDGDLSAIARFSAIRERLAEHGFALASTAYVDRPATIAAGKDGLNALLHDHPNVDAVFFSNDTTATGGMVHCIENGIAVPGDLALIGFSGLEIGQTMPWKLTTIETKRYEIGRISARSILNRLAGQNPDRIVEVDVTLIKGETA